MKLVGMTLLGLLVVFQKWRWWLLWLWSTRCYFHLYPRL